MKINVSHVAKLANLEIDKDEIKQFESQLLSILSYIEKLKSVNTEKVKETTQVTNLENVLREDEATPSLSQDEALKNAKSQHNGLFKVHAILQE